MTDSHAEFRKQIVDASNNLMNTGVLSFSGHGNASVRIPGTDTMLLTGVSTLMNTRPDTLAVVDFEGNAVEGGSHPPRVRLFKCTPASTENVMMCSRSFTRTPPTPRLSRSRTAHPVSVRGATAYGAGSGHPGCCPGGQRGSEASVRYIVEAVNNNPGTMAVLLANHGVLAFGVDAPGAARGIIAMEEAAAMTLAAKQLAAPSPSPQTR